MVEGLRVGFIGLGNLGSLVAKQLLRAGQPLVVYDLRPEVVAEAAALGATAAGSCREVAASSDILISLVRDSAQTEAAMSGPDGVWAGIRRGSVIVIASTVSPAYCRALHARARQQGVQVVDAAISTESRDFTPGRESAELTLMVGGEEEAVRRCWPLFRKMAKNVFHLGGVGAGQACKIVNNLAMFGNAMVARECLALGVKAGLDAQTLLAAMRVSTGNSRSLGALQRQLLRPPPQPASRPAGEQDLGKKDRELALELAEAVGAEVPVARFLVQLAEAAEAAEAGL